MRKVPVAQHHRPDGTHQEACAENGEGHHQRGKLAARRKKGVRDIGGVKAEQKKVELLEKVSRGDAKDRASPGANRVDWCRGGFH